MRAKLSTTCRTIASCFAGRIQIAQARHDQVSCRTIIDRLVAGDKLVHRFVQPTQYNQHSLTRSGPRPSGTFPILERYHLGARESAFQHAESSSMSLSQMEASPRRGFILRKTGLRSATRRDNEDATRSKSSAHSILHNSHNVNKPSSSPAGG